MRDEEAVTASIPSALSRQPTVVDFLRDDITSAKSCRSCCGNNTGRDDKRRAVRKLDGADKATAVCLGLSYACLVFCRNFLAPLAAALKSDTGLGYTNDSHGSLLVAVGVSYGLGKLINGALVDALPPRTCYIFFALVSIASVFMLSLVDSMMDGANEEEKFQYMTAVCMINALVQSGGWPAACKFVYLRFKPAQYGSVFSVLGLSSKGGGVLTSIALGALLEVMDWQGVTRVACAITLFGLIPILATFRFQHSEEDIQQFASSPEDFVHRRDHFDTPAPDASQQAGNQALHTSAGCCATLRQYGQWWCNRRFLLMGASASFMGVLTGFDAFTALWISDTLPSASDSLAGAATACNPLGMLLSIAVFGYLLNKRTRPAQATAVIVMLFILLLVIVFLGSFTWFLLGHDCASDPTSCTAVAGGGLVVYGLCLGYAYYIPPSVFALHFGGANSAMVASMFDMVTAVVGAAFTKLCTWLSGVDKAGWVYAWGLLAVASFLAFIFFTLFHFHELKDKRYKQAQSMKGIEARNLL